jgi:holo-[acyl-carrier protein] synthase
VRPSLAGGVKQQEDASVRIVGHGIDLVPVARIAEMIADHGERFLTRVFTPGELAYCNDRKGRDQHLAARFAMKEAVLKAIGTGWRSGIAWADVETVLLPSGQPTVALHGEAARVARELGATAWHVSITHADGRAMASAIATGE